MPNRKIIAFSIKIDHTYAPKTNKSGVNVSGLMSVEANTAVVTKAGSASYSVARMIESTAVGMDDSTTPALYAMP